MGNEKRIIFDPFSLDLSGQSLWKGSQSVRLRPKAFEVLHYLLRRPGQLITKEELLNAVWPEIFVGEAVLKVAIRQIREALGDDSAMPRFIETAHRRGYRFIGSISTSAEGAPSDAGRAPISAPRAAEAVPKVVGRDRALSRMQSWLEKMLGGERQIIFVTGEAGIGKTSLVDTFARNLASSIPGVRIVRGQCLEQYGTSEAYLPVLEAIGRLCREQARLVDVLRAHAPMWLLQLPSLVSASDRELLGRELAGATRERMLREMGNALEALTAEQPLVLILEDLHWSDYSTLDLISYLARQRQAAHLMLIGTYRPVELIVSGHPLKAVKRELLVKQQCEELPLEYLTKDAIAQYLADRFPRNRFPKELATLIHERTEGSPLFMVNAVDYLVAEKSIVEHEGRWDLRVGIDAVELGVPDSIRQMIEKQIDHLGPEDQRILEAASAAGAEFSTSTIAAGLRETPARVQSRCDELARQHQLIQDRGIQVLPNGELLSRYGFIHALYQSVLYDRLPASTRIQLHRRIGEQAEALYGERARDIAAELAMHFDRGSSYRQAAKYLQQAAENDIRRFAYQDAIPVARRGLELLAKTADTAERAEQELSLQLTLGVPLIATEGYAAPEVGRVYLRARELCHRLGDSAEMSQVLWGVWTFHVLRAELHTAREIAEEYLRLAERLPYPDLAMRGHLAMQVTFTHTGHFVPAIEYFEKVSMLYDHERHRDDSFYYALNPGVVMRCFAAWAFWFAGRPDTAVNTIREALTLARELSEPHGVVHALFFAAILHQLRGEKDRAQEYAEAVIALAGEHGMVMYQALGTMTRGWALLGSEQENQAIEDMRQGLAAHHATGAHLMRPHFLALLAEAFAKPGHTEEGIRLLDEALELAQSNLEGCYLAELYRLKGELLLMRSVRRAASQAMGAAARSAVASPVVKQVEDCFGHSIRIAREQQAKSLELRAAISLARLHRNQGQGNDARLLLAEICNRFTEGFDTVDFREAKDLLDEL